MNRARLGDTFEKFLTHFFEKLGFQVEQDLTVGPNNRTHVDLVIKKKMTTTWVEVKFYRDDRVSMNNVMNAVSQLGAILQLTADEITGLIILSAYVPLTLKEDIKSRFGIAVWDRSDLYHLIQNRLKEDKLLEEFETLLLSARQGTDIQNVFDKVEKNLLKTSSDYSWLLDFPVVQERITSPPRYGSQMCTELKEIPSGKFGWPLYEKKCIEILKYIFDGELSNWDAQNTTDDELSRFDMICRVVGQSGFWGSLIQSFQTRYVLFEFKNYTDPIGQSQIYTTERYLYLRGLRSVGFIICRVGGNAQADTAAKGALREHGKLIIILNNEDLCKMLHMKDSGDNPSDYLSDILDAFLISLSR